MCVHCCTTPHIFISRNQKVDYQGMQQLLIDQRLARLTTPRHAHIMIVTQCQVPSSTIIELYVRA